MVVACHGGLVEATMLSFLPLSDRTRPLGLPTAYTSMTEWELDASQLAAPALQRRRSSRWADHGSKRRTPQGNPSGSAGVVAVESVGRRAVRVLDEPRRP